MQQHVATPGVSRRYSPCILSVMAKPTNKSLTTSNSSDNWFDRIAINHLSHSLQATIGFRSNKSGYEGLVEATTMIRQTFSPSQQRELVIQALDAAFPKPILSIIRAVLPPSKFQRELFAVFTTIFFPWLVGPCEVRIGLMCHCTLETRGKPYLAYHLKLQPINATFSPYFPQHLRWLNY